MRKGVILQRYKQFLWNIQMNIFQRLFPENPIPSTVSFEEVKLAITAQSSNTWIINTLPQNEQDVLISGTVPAHDEESLINTDLENYDLATRSIIIYGRNTCDITAETKYRQLAQLGAKRVALYRGGLFEWLLLQDIYGFADFPTTKRVLDILRYK